MFSLGLKNVRIVCVRMQVAWGSSVVSRCTTLLLACFWLMFVVYNVWPILIGCLCALHAHVCPMLSPCWMIAFVFLAARHKMNQPAEDDQPSWLKVVDPLAGTYYVPWSLIQATSGSTSVCIKPRDISVCLLYQKGAIHSLHCSTQHNIAWNSYACAAIEPFGCYATHFHHTLTLSLCTFALPFVSAGRQLWSNGFTQRHRTVARCFFGARHSRLTAPLQLRISDVQPYTAPLRLHTVFTLPLRLTLPLCTFTRGAHLPGAFGGISTHCAPAVCAFQ